MIGEVEEATIKEWKAKYGEVFAAKVGESICYLKKPNRTVLSAMSTIANDGVKASELLLNNCWLGGDENIKTDDALFFGVVQVLSKLVEIKTAQLEKL